MANPNAYTPNQFRPHFAGSASDDDIHIEAYDSDVQSAFEHRSLFVAEQLSTLKKLSNSNTYRGDRLSGNLEVKGRSSGEKLESTAVKSEKFILQANIMTYTRVPIDYQDAWTAPSFRNELARNAGTSHAKSYDQAHCIQLLKCADWEAPPTLAGTFTPISERLNTLDFTGLSEEEAADDIVQTIKRIGESFLFDKDITVHDLVILVEPAWFSILMEHKKLMNVRYSHSAGSDYAMRRIAYVNGIRIIEANVFPEGAIEGHELGPDFDVTAEEATAKAIVFHPRSVLVTAEAKSLTNRAWDDEREMSSVLDTYRLYNAGMRRPDLVAVLREAAAE